MSEALDKLDAVRQWVRDGIGDALEEDPSGFLLGVQSVSVIEALDCIERALRSLSATQ